MQLMGGFCEQGNESLELMKDSSPKYISFLISLGTLLEDLKKV
jgi:hypothetical protein